MQRGKMRTLLSGHAGRVWAVAFAADGRRLASGDEQGEVIVRTDAGEELCRWTGYGHGHLAGLAFAPNGRRLATIGVTQSYVGPEGESWSQGEKHLALFNPETGRCVRRLHAPEGHSVTYSRDGRWLATGHRGHQVGLWDAATGQVRAILTGHADIVAWVAFAPAGDRIASASGDGTARVWTVG